MSTVRSGSLLVASGFGLLPVDDDKLPPNRERELRQAAPGEQALEGEGTARVRGRGEVGPDDRDGLALGDGEGVEGLYIAREGKGTGQLSSGIEGEGTCARAKRRR